MQVRYDGLLKEHMALYGKYVAVVAGGPINRDVDKVLGAVDTYYQTLMHSEDKIDREVLRQKE